VNIARSTDYEVVEKRLEKFLRAQTSVFQFCEELKQWCAASIEGDYDQANYEVAKHIAKDVAAFEVAFDAFEVEFWNYVEDVDRTRSRVDRMVSQAGMADHKEYFFGKIEACTARLSDVFAEVNAAELDWPFLDELEKSLEGLYDVTEDLIDIDPSRLENSLIAELLAMVPMQRVAPLEVIATPSSIRRKATTRVSSRVDDAHIEQAMLALRGIVGDTCEELNRSNCDPRIRKSFGKCLDEISKARELFSPISFGIYVSVANSFKDIATEEFSPFLGRQVVATLLQCDIFLRNFDAWTEYSRGDLGSATDDSAAALRDFRAMIDEPLFEEDVRTAVELLLEDRRDFGARGKIDHSIFQSISNTISEVCRQGLRLASTARRSFSSLIGDTIWDAGKAGVGLLAVGWIIQHKDALLLLASQYQFLSWIKPVVEFFITGHGA